MYCYFSEKIRLDVSYESSAVQTIHMKCQALFSLKEISRDVCYGFGKCFKG